MSTSCPDRLNMDTLAEWLRRRPAKPMGSPRVGSNPTGVDVSWVHGTHAPHHPRLLSTRPIRGLNMPGRFPIDIRTPPVDLRFCLSWVF